MSHMSRRTNTDSISIIPQKVTVVNMFTKKSDEPIVRYGQLQSNIAK